MNARIIKETRSLLPVFGVLLLASVAPPLIWKRDTASGVAMIASVACAAILGASSLGNEFQWRTLGLLLSQPVSRRRLWLEKMLVLGTAMAIGYLVFLACTYVPDGGDMAMRWFLALVPLGILCSAPYLALAVKNTIGAAALTVLLPFGGGLLLAALCDSFIRFFNHVSPRLSQEVASFYDGHIFLFVVVPALIYCAVFGWLGYAKFMQLQAVESQAQDINLPPRMEAALARPLRLLVPGYTGPWASLFRKELQLQRPSFIIAGLMVALAPLQVVLWKLFHSDIAAGTLGMNFIMCVFVIPLVAAGMSVAEERNLGVAGWQFIQPVSARRQWSAKMLVVLFICVTLGILLPLAGAAIGEIVFGFDGPGRHLPHANTGVDAAFLILAPPLIYLLVLSLGVFASSVSRTTLQAVIHTLALITLAIGVVTIIFWAGEDFIDHNNYQLNYPLEPLGRNATTEQVEQFHRLMNRMAHAFQVIELCLIATAGALLVLLLGVTQFLAHANFRQGEQAAHNRWIKSGVFLIIIGGLAWVMVLVIAYLPDVLMPILMKQ
jgi:ABC-type transport system involved in multi-copper enzyme maturation permease subunit